MNAARRTLGLGLLLILSGALLSGCELPEALHPVAQTVKSWLPGSAAKPTGKETASAGGVKTSIASPPYIPELPAEEPVDDALDPEFYDADLEHILLEGGPTEDDPTAEQDTMTPGTQPNPNGEATFQDSSLDSHRVSGAGSAPVNILRQNPLAGEEPILPSQQRRLQQQRAAARAAAEKASAPAALPTPGAAANMTSNKTPH
ncbi:MAG: hypothetical protein AB7P76_07625 [Candidatus Melainabacteria bacterium]